MDRRKIIIDTDCGSDDAMAIAMALNDERYEIIMITTLSGNVRSRQAAVNVLNVLKKTDTYYPKVYLGSDDMLKRDWVGSADTHGNDGMGDLGLVDNSLIPEEGEAVDKILEALKENEDRQIDIICLGPLTNMARAFAKDPETMRRARRIIAMATTGDAPGNVTDHAEFNVWQDAEAFDAVLATYFDGLYLVGWSCCLNEAMLDEQDIEKIKNSSPLGEYLIASNRILMDMNKERFSKTCLDMADPAAMAAALEPDCIDTCKLLYCRTDLSATERYGAVYYDYEGRFSMRANANVILKLKADRFKDYLFRMLKV